MKSLLLDYWFGNKTLLRTFVCFLLLPSIAILLLRKGLLQQFPDSKSGQLIVVGYLFLIIYAITCVITLAGINRKTRIIDGGYGANTNVTLCNVLSLVVIVYTATNTVDLLTVSVRPANKEVSITHSPTYTRNSIDPDILVVQGDIDIAATRRLSVFLEQNTGIKKLVLESEGGNVFEARGMARLVSTNSLHTHVDGKCLSACTLIYVSGAERTAGHNAEFGFHSYRQRTNNGGVGIDIDEQQNIDAGIFASAGVDKRFIEQMYQAEHKDMWFPERKRLIEARVINR